MRGFVRAAAFAAVAVSLGVAHEARAASGPPQADWSQFPDGDQCLVAIQVFYSNKFGASVGIAANNYNGSCAPQGACHVWLDNTPDPAKFNRYAWGTTTPQAYDIVVFPPASGDPYGHIASVDHTDASGTVWIMDDNWNLDQRKASCTFNNNVCGDPHTWNQAGWQPYGVYRLKSLDDRPPQGWLDAAACDAIAGWAQDPDTATSSISVDIYFDGPAGSGSQGVRTSAGNYRADLCSAIGSCNHGLSLATPRGLLDNKAHQAFAYGIDSSGNGNNPLLQGAPKSFTCAPPPLPFTPAIKRHVADPATMTSWKFSYLWDVAHYDDAKVTALADGANVPSAPQLVQADDGTPEVWLVDGMTRRHVVSPASMTAWRFDAAAIKKTPAAQVYALMKGLDWPDAPFLVMGSGPAVYVIDHAPPPASPPPAVDAGSDASLDVDASTGAPGSTDGTAGQAANDAPSDSGGCAATGARGEQGVAGASIVLVAVAIARSRRRASKRA